MIGSVRGAGRPAGLRGQGNGANPSERIRSPHLLPVLVRQAAKTLGYPSSDSFEVFLEGYEDCNVAVSCGTQQFVLRVFASERDSGFADRYVAAVTAARAAGVRHPMLLHGEGGRIVQHDAPTGNTYVAMKRAAGTAVSRLNAPPPRSVITEVLGQAASLHGIGEVVVQDVRDVWAPTRFDVLYRNLRRHAAPGVEDVLAPAVDAWRRLDVTRLPVCPIHGDLSRTNVLVEPTEEVEILDLASIGRYPRIQELAFVAVNLMHGDERNLFERVRLVADLYSRHSPLTPDEDRALDDFALVTAAMEVLGALFYRHVRGWTTQENDEVMRIGMDALRSVGRGASER
jgi:Ser/Thr protein kinase RdoA (MazF antagonist)